MADALGKKWKFCKLKQTSYFFYLREQAGVQIKAWNLLKVRKGVLSPVLSAHILPVM